MKSFYSKSHFLLNEERSDSLIRLSRRMKFILKTLLFLGVQYAVFSKELKLTTEDQVANLKNVLIDLVGQDPIKGVEALSAEGMARVNRFHDFEYLLLT